MTFLWNTFSEKPIVSYYQLQCFAIFPSHEFSLERDASTREHEIELGSLEMKRIAMTHTALSYNLIHFIIWSRRRRKSKRKPEGTKRNNFVMILFSLYRAAGFEGRFTRISHFPLRFLFSFISWNLTFILVYSCEFYFFTPSRFLSLSLFHHTSLKETINQSTLFLVVNAYTMCWLFIPAFLYIRVSIPAKKDPKKVHVRVRVFLVYM